MPPHQPVEFIGDAHHRDQQQQMHPDTDPDVLPVDVAENDTAAQDGHDDDHKEEAGAAAGMMLGLDAGVSTVRGRPAS